MCNQPFIEYGVDIIVTGDKEILEKDDSKNLIIDLRDNGGGDLSSVVDICDLFLPKDKLITKLQ